MIGNKIADKITSVGKSKKDDKTKKVEEIYISPEKRQQAIDDFKIVLWFLLYKNVISKNCKFAWQDFWW